MCLFRGLDALRAITRDNRGISSSEVVVGTSLGPRYLRRRSRELRGWYNSRTRSQIRRKTLEPSQSISYDRCRLGYAHPGQQRSRVRGSEMPQSPDEKCLGAIRSDSQEFSQHPCSGTDRDTCTVEASSPSMNAGGEASSKDQLARPRSLSWRSSCSSSHPVWCRRALRARSSSHRAPGARVSCSFFCHPSSDLWKGAIQLKRRRVNGRILWRLSAKFQGPETRAIRTFIESVFVFIFCSMQVFLLCFRSIAAR